MANAVKIRTFWSVPSWRLAVLLLVVFAFFGGGYARDMLFLGVTDARGEPVQAELEREMRVEFAASPGFRLIGEVETQRVLREAERQGRSRAEGFIPRSARLADSVVVIRAVVKEVAVVPGRGLLLFGKIDARMVVELFFGEVSGPASYRGEFSAAATKRKDVILFASPKTAVHISATEREELLGQMRAKIIKEASSLAAVFFNSLSAGAAGGIAGGAGGGVAADSAEFSTVDGAEVQPLDAAGVSEGASGGAGAVDAPK